MQNNNIIGQNYFSEVFIDYYIYYYIGNKDNIYKNQ